MLPLVANKNTSIFESVIIKVGGKSHVFNSQVTVQTNQASQVKSSHSIKQEQISLPHDLIHFSSEINFNYTFKIIMFLNITFRK